MQFQPASQLSQASNASVGGFTPTTSKAVIVKQPKVSAAPANPDNPLQTLMTVSTVNNAPNIAPTEVTLSDGKTKITLTPYQMIAMGPLFDDKGKVKPRYSIDRKDGNGSIIVIVNGGKNGEILFGAKGQWFTGSTFERNWTHPSMRRDLAFDDVTPYPAR